jgi:hypothetical protein
MDAPKMEVKCGVDTCSYWKSNMCYANKLEVNPMRNDAKTSSDTCCTTFKPQAT